MSKTYLFKTYSTTTNISKKILLIYTYFISNKYEHIIMILI